MGYDTSNAERTDELLGNLHSEIESLVTGDEWKAALEWQARFHTYSFNNTLLIALQRPNATYVGGAKSVWNKLGRHVRKGEKGIGILAPITIKKTDEDTGESRYVPINRYRTVYVFDVSQTEGEPFEPPKVTHPDELQGEVPVELYSKLVQLFISHSYIVVEDDSLVPDGAKGVTLPEQKQVVVRSLMSPLQRTKTLVHELAHVALHCDADEPFSYRSCRGQAEVEAESVAYIVCAALGLPTDSYSFPYVAGWSGGDLDLVKKSGQRVAKTARTILEAVEKNTQEVAA